ncbi:MAG: thiamine pyrophosphate-dependent enzyme [Thermoplasmatales archaeon]
MLNAPTKPQSYKTDVEIDWCPGCGDFGILNALVLALQELKIPNENVVLTGGIGCSSKIPHYVNVNALHTLHGRSLVQAEAVKIANPQLEVISSAGDGDALGIGSAHFVAAGRRNVDLTYLIFDNGVYGLTKGQASPTLPYGEMPKSLETENIKFPVNPIFLGLASGFTFVARSYSYNIKHLKETIIRAIKHRGTAVIDIMQPCVTYNNINTKEFYDPRLYDIEKEGWNPVAENENEYREKVGQAVGKSLEWGDRIPMGVFIDYRTETYDEKLRKLIPDYGKRNYVFDPIEKNGKPLQDVSEMMDSLL